jgi:hypothetical protein
MQGDTLAPCLFIMVLDCLLHELKLLKGFPLDEVPQPSKRRSRGPAKLPPVIEELGYADDLLFPCKKFEDMEPLLRELQKVAKSVGLDINLKKGKTEYIIVNAPDGAQFPEVRAPNSDGELVVINQANDYIYLGTHAINSSAQVERRVGFAWAAVRKFRPFWDSKCPFKVRAQLFLCLVQSALTYGMELITPDLADQLDVRYKKMLQFVFCRGNQDADTWDVYHNGYFPHLSSLLIKRRIKLIGHVMRRDEPLTRILQTNRIMCFHKNGPDGRRQTLLKEISRHFATPSLGDDQRYSVRHALPHTKWPKPTDRDAWRRLADECAAQHEDSIYASLAAARATRWRVACKDPLTLDGSINRSELQALLKLVNFPEDSHELHRDDRQLYRCEHWDFNQTLEQMVCAKCFDTLASSIVTPRVNTFAPPLQRRCCKAPAAAPESGPPEHVLLATMKYDEM